MPVNVVCRKNSATIEIAKKELLEGWQGKSGETVMLTLKKD
ncbi:MAG TPA: hypothetical protein VNS32_23065 [Flavisolibacter sp.]|nr:hypothetical protein [Flavisolibacter sp.]